MRRTSWFAGLAVVGGAIALASCGGGGGGGLPSDATVTFLTTSLPSGVTGEAYSAQFDASFPHPPGSFLVISGTLPPGLAVDGASGEVSGTPRRTGTFHFEVAARDGVDKTLPAGRDVNYGEAHKTFDVSVARGLPNILTTFLPAAQYRASYSAFIDVAGGVAPYTFEEVGSNLPAGLSVQSDGEVGSFPTQARAEPYAFTVKVTDANGDTDTQEIQISVIVKPLAIATAATLPDAGKDFAYDVVLSLASPGGGPPYTWSQATLQPGDTAGAVPLSQIGMEVSTDGHVRTIGGGPVTGAFGTYRFTAQVEDVASQTTLRQFTLTVVHLAPSISSITPNRYLATGPWLVKGANFLPGALLQMTFAPGTPIAASIVPTYVDASTLQFTPPNLGPVGPVGIRVTSGNGDTVTKPNSFFYPLANLAFGAKGFISSPISSFGLDCADVDGDGRAEVLHCGASGFQNMPGLTTWTGFAQSTAGGLVLLHNDGGSPLSFTTVGLDGGSWYDAKFADVNVDGKVDIVAIGASQVKTWLNGMNGDPLGTFSTGPTSSLPTGFNYPSEMVVCSVNGDAIPDIAFAVAHVSNPNGRVYTMAGTGTGSFSILGQAASTITNTYGVSSLAAVDLNADGRQDVVAGTGFDTSFSGNPLVHYAVTQSSGLFGSWIGPSPYASYLWGNTLGVASGNFLGTGTPAVVAAHTVDPEDSTGISNGGTYSLRQLTLYSGSTLSTTSDLINGAGDAVKCLAAFDGNFDAATEFALATGGMTTNMAGAVLVYRGGNPPTTSAALTLDPTAGSPSISNPRLGRIASGDLDGDGKPDLLVTTSYWASDYQPNLYGSPSDTYSLQLAGNGGSMGIVYWLNTSN